MTNDKNVYSRVVARAWTDPAFKARFLADPAAVLKECGAKLTGSVPVRVIEEQNEELILVLPRKPADFDVSAQDLEARVMGECEVKCCCV